MSEQRVRRPTSSQGYVVGAREVGRVLPGVRHRAPARLDGLDPSLVLLEVGCGRMADSGAPDVEGPGPSSDHLRCDRRRNVGAPYEERHRVDGPRPMRVKQRVPHLEADAPEREPYPPRTEDDRMGTRQHDPRDLRPGTDGLVPCIREDGGHRPVRDLPQQCGSITGMKPFHLRLACRRAKTGARC